jgi:hypothetical protein
VFTDAIIKTRSINKGTEDNFQVHNKAVVPTLQEEGKTIPFQAAYAPCGVGARSMVLARERSKTGSWEIPTISIHTLLLNKHVTLLKIDIDSIEGALLHTATSMIAENLTRVDSILIELGHDAGGIAACDLCRKQPAQCHHLSRRAMKRCAMHDLSMHPRGGDISDIHRLMHEFGYFVYRVNICTNREIFNWKGENVNPKMSPPHPGLIPIFGARAMKKIEQIPPNMPAEQYKDMNRFGTSFLITREVITEVAQHHTIDLEYSGIKYMSVLNEGRPASMLH